MHQSTQLRPTLWIYQTPNISLNLLKHNWEFMCQFYLWGRATNFPKHNTHKVSCFFNKLETWSSWFFCSGDNSPHRSISHVFHALIPFVHTNVAISSLVNILKEWCVGPRCMSRCLQMDVDYDPQIHNNSWILSWVVWRWKPLLQTSWKHGRFFSGRWWV